MPIMPEGKVDATGYHGEPTNMSIRQMQQLCKPLGVDIMDT